VCSFVSHAFAARPPIGYLTQLEALRYLTVGSYYKIPELPIWVIGSQSHFTVLFSMQPEVNEETEAEQLLSSVRRAWISVDSEVATRLPMTRLFGVRPCVHRRCAHIRSPCAPTDSKQGSSPRSN
jgi:hypothetical protein